MDIVKVTAEIEYPANPWDAIYKAVYELIIKGVETSEIRILCSELVQRYLKTMMMDQNNITLPYGVKYDSIMFMGITFENYPFNTEILIFAAKACYYPGLCIKLPLEFSAIETNVKLQNKEDERRNSKSAD